MEYQKNWLWVFGTLSPLPESLEWDSIAVEHILKTSQQIILPPELKSSENNPLKIIGAMNKVRKARKLKNKQRLDDVLDADLYQRFESAQKRYAPKNKKLYQFRPIVAAEKLLKSALQNIGMVGSNKIEKRLRKLARRNKVNEVSSTVDIDLNQALQFFDTLSMEAEIVCLTSVLDAMDMGMQQTINRALAWADGARDILERYTFPNADKSCIKALSSAEGIKLARQQSREIWLDNAFRALQTNRDSFAYLPLYEIDSEKGLLNLLLQKIPHKGAVAKTILRPLQ